MGQAKELARNCTKCGTYHNAAAYLPTRSPFFVDGKLPICVNCLEEGLDGSNLRAIDKFCQWADYPFLPDEWMKIYKVYGRRSLSQYAKLFGDNQPYAELTWGEINQQWKDILEMGEAAYKLPELSTAEKYKLQQVWENDEYSLKDLMTLQKLYDELQRTQNINTGLQHDEAKKICKISLEMDKCLRNGVDDSKTFKDLMSIYKDLTNLADFTPKSAKNISNFDSVGELVLFLEKAGWQNTFYDGESRDIVDETIKNIEIYNRRLVLGETTMGDEIEKKFKSMGIANILEDGLTEDAYYSDNPMKVTEIDDEEDRYEEEFREEE
jgi:hypothetical protein